VITLNGPPPGHTFTVGEDVLATAAVTDVEDGVLTSQLQWRTTLGVHCGTAPGAACHHHPGSDGPPGGSFGRPFDDHGGYTYLEVPRPCRTAPRCTPAARSRPGRGSAR
jgi:hypothetical protein